VSDLNILWAHSPAAGSNRWHSLADHLRGTAELARQFAAPFGGGEVAYWLGALHDVGKAACAWQDKLAAVAGTDNKVGHHPSLHGLPLSRGQRGGFDHGKSTNHGGDGARLVRMARASLGGRFAELLSRIVSQPGSGSGVVGLGSASMIFRETRTDPGLQCRPHGT
jgi:hypothetical protein